MGKPIGKAGSDLIKRFEGCRLDAYRDAVGIWTIGYGHTGNVVPGTHITQAQADRYLRQDCQRFADYVDQPSYVAIPLNASQRDALISFAFNLGPGNLKTLCKNRNALQIADAIPRYCRAGGRELLGLKHRREAEKALFCGIKTPSSGTTPAQESASLKYHGIDYRPVFDPHYYAAHYPDLKRAFGVDCHALFSHFITYGMREGRNGNAAFCAAHYRRRYTDLQRAFGNNLEKYYRHYLEYGIKEKRNGK